MKITKDGFVWITVEPSLAIKIWNSDIFTLYALYSDDSESMIENESQLIAAISKGLEIGIEGGQLENYGTEKERSTYLCKCNKCNAILIDENPAEDSIKYEMNGNEKNMEFLKDDCGWFWGCPNCKTDGYLMDL